MRRVRKLYGQEQGLAHVALVLIVVIVIAVVGFAGYTVYNNSGSGKKASTTTTTTTTKTEAVAADQGCVTTYKDENLCKFAAEGGKLDNLAFKATVTSTGGQDAGVFTIINDGKGNSSLTGTMAGQELSSVTYGGHYYLKSPGSDSWVDYGASNDDQNPTKDLSLVLGSGLTFTPEGKEACGSLTCFKYDLKDTATPDHTQTVWFDTKSYLARQWKDVGSDSDGQTATTTMVIEYSKGISISKPSPVTALNE